MPRVVCGAAGSFASFMETQMRIILNLTQHTATAEQIAQGVMEFPSKPRYGGRGQIKRSDLTRLLTLEENILGETWRVLDVAQRIALGVAVVKWNAGWIGFPSDYKFKKGEFCAMIGGAPVLMPPLELALRHYDIIPLYAFSNPESEEKAEDGVVKKIAVFRHLGFAEGQVPNTVVDDVLQKGRGGRGKIGRAA